MHKEPAIWIGIAFAVLGAIASLVQGGGFKDGIQLDEIAAILGPIAAGLGIRSQVFSQFTADLMATRTAQRQAVEQRKGR
jgi:hypothetical protein